MDNIQRRELRGKSVYMALIVLAGLASLSVGCNNRSQDDTKPPAPATVQAVKQQQAQGVQTNPSMPPAVRSQIISQMNGSAPPMGPHAH